MDDLFMLLNSRKNTKGERTLTTQSDPFPAFNTDWCNIISKLWISAKQSLFITFSRKLFCYYYCKTFKTKKWWKNEMTQTRREGVFLKLVIDDTYWNVIFVCCKRKSHKNKLNMHRRFFPFYVAPLFHKAFIVVTLIILLGDAGNPKSLRARKGKLFSSRLLDLYSSLYL